MDFNTQEENFTNVMVGGMTYSISRFSPTPALKLSTRLAKFIGPAIAVAIKEFQGKEKKQMTAKDLNIAGIVQSILPSLEEEMVANTVKDLISCCSYQGMELRGQNYETHFTGSKLKNLFPLVGKVVEYQFSDFLSGLLTGKTPL